MFIFQESLQAMEKTFICFTDEVLASLVFHEFDSTLPLGFIKVKGNPVHISFLLAG
jgi:hypothetical protein